MNDSNDSETSSVKNEEINKEIKQQKIYKNNFSKVFTNEF